MARRRERKGADIMKRDGAKSTKPIDRRSQWCPELIVRKQGFVSRTRVEKSAIDHSLLWEYISRVRAKREPLFLSPNSEIVG
jgi:hypothetical protein